MGHVRYNVPKIQNLTILNQIYCYFHLKKIVFTVFSSIVESPVVTVWYYHLPFLSNIEKTSILQASKIGLSWYQDLHD